MQIRACGGTSLESDSLDMLRWRLYRLARVGTDMPGMGRSTARLATWFAIDEGTASRVLVATRDDEERAVMVMLFAEEAEPLGLADALRHMDTWANTLGARRLLLAWRIAALAPPDMRLFWAWKLAGLPAKGG